MIWKEETRKVIRDAAGMDHVGVISSWDELLRLLQHERPDLAPFTVVTQTRQVTEWTADGEPACMAHRYGASCIQHGEHARHVDQYGNEWEGEFAALGPDSGAVMSIYQTLAETQRQLDDALALLDEATEMIIAQRDALAAADKAFEGWSYGTAFTAVERMRLAVRAPELPTRALLVRLGRDQ